MNATRHVAYVPDQITPECISAGPSVGSLENLAAAGRAVNDHADVQ